MAVAPDGTWLATAGDDGTVRIWDPTTGTPPHPHRPHRRGARRGGRPGRHLARHRQATTARSGSGTRTTGQPRHTLTGHTNRITALVADPSGRWLASAGADGVIGLWHVEAGERRARLLASDDGWAALLTDGTVKVHGRPAGLWWAAGLCRFEVDDLPLLARHRPSLRPLPDDQVILHG